MVISFFRLCFTGKQVILSLSSLCCWKLFLFLLLILFPSLMMTVSYGALCSCSVQPISCIATQSPNKTEFPKTAFILPPPWMTEPQSLSDARRLRDFHTHTLTHSIIDHTTIQCSTPNAHHSPLTKKPTSCRPRLARLSIKTNNPHEPSANRVVILGRRELVSGYLGACNVLV